MVVSGFCASAGAAPRMAHAMISVFITDVLSLLRGDRAGRTLPSLLRCRGLSASMGRIRMLGIMPGHRRAFCGQH